MIPVFSGFHLFPYDAYTAWRSGAAWLCAGPLSKNLQMRADVYKYTQRTGHKDRIYIEQAMPRVALRS